MRKLAIILSLFVAASAFAGRGGSYERMNRAISGGDVDAIIAEFERAERLVCGKCVEPAMALLDHSDYRVREVAAWWFARRPFLKAAITMQSLARLSGSDGRAAGYAADVLGTFRHPAVIPALAAALGREYPAETKVAVLRALGTIGHPGAEAAVVGALGDSSAETRAAAAQAYLQLRGPRDGAALVGLLSDGDVKVRREAAAVLGEKRTAAARAALEALLAGDADALVRRNAAWALVKIGDPGSRAALERAATSDPVMFVRSSASPGLALPR